MRDRSNTGAGGGVTGPVWRGRTARLLVALLAITLIAGACGGASDSADTAADASSDDSGFAMSAAADAVEDAGDVAMEAEPLGAASASKAGGVDGEALRVDGADALGAPAQPIVDIGRDIIYTAAVTVSTNDVTAASNEAAQIITGLGGVLFGQSSTSQPTARSVLTFKVRPEDFQTALAQLGGIGDVRDQSVSADDVTERVVDLQSRIATSAASVERLQGLLDDASDITAIARIESELLARETTLETLRGQLRTIQDRVDLATITLTIVEARTQPQIAFDATLYPGHDQGIACDGSRELRVETGEAITMCLTVTNTGDTPLASLTFTDATVGLDRNDDLIIVWGDPDDVLQPGDSWTFAYETEATDSLNTRTRVTAQPVDEDGASAGPQIGQTDTNRIVTVEPESDPGFSDGLRGSWNFLKDLGRALLVLLGALLPFIWIIPVVWFARRWWKNRTAARVATPAPTTSATSPTTSGPTSATSATPPAPRRTDAGATPDGAIRDET